MTWTGCDCPICQNTEIEAHRDELVAQRDQLVGIWTDEDDLEPGVLARLDEAIARAQDSLDALTEAQQAHFERELRRDRDLGFG